MSSLILHLHPLSSYCHKVLIGLYEKGIPFEPRTVNLGDPAERQAYAVLWPTAKIPLLEDRAAGRVVPETSIMLEYLDRLHPGAPLLFPADPERQMQARLWDRLFDNYVMTPMQRIVADRLRPEDRRDELNVTEARQLLDMAYAMAERQLAANTWAAGPDFTVADCAAAPALFYAHIVHPFPPELKALPAYFERLLQRDSVRRVLQEARPWLKYFPYADRTPARFLEG
jgi:glutathione S-transferase